MDVTIIDTTIIIPIGIPYHCSYRMPKRYFPISIDTLNLWQ